MKLARLKTIFRNSKYIDVIADKLDENSVDTINIVNDAVNTDKIADESITFDKMTSNTKYITTNIDDVSFIDIGGIKEGSKIANNTSNDLLNKILQPSTDAKVEISYKLNNDSYKYNISPDTYLSNSKKYNIYKNDKTISDFVINNFNLDILDAQVKIMKRSSEIGKVEISCTVLYDTTTVFVFNKTYNVQNTDGNIIDIPLGNTFKKLDISIYDNDITDLRLEFSIVVYYANDSGGCTFVDKTYIIPPIYYGTSNIDTTTLSFGEYEFDTTIIDDRANELFTNKIYYDTIRGSSHDISLTFPPYTKSYAYIIIPASSHISNIVDNNNNTQVIDFVADILSPDDDGVFASSKIRYKLFKLSKCTTTTNHTYTFKIKQ